MKRKRAAKKPERNIWEPRDPNDPPLTLGSHGQLWQIAIKLPTDYEPYGQMKRESIVDCSCGYLWFHPLVTFPHDWGGCTNPASPRVGLLRQARRGVSARPG